MSELAVVVMAYNEASVLQRCLDSVAGLEIHVSVDEQTTDESLQIAKAHDVHLYRHQGLPAQPPEEDDPDAAKAVNSYSRMRNDVLDDVCQQSRAPWFLWLDADEIVTAGMGELLDVLPQMPATIDAIAVQMHLYDGDVCGSVMRNSKVIRRNVRFTRRRHEHIVITGEQALCNEFVIEHRSTQPAQVRAEHDMRKRGYKAFIEDWRQFRDGRAAFYLGDWWNGAGDRETALRWYQAGLDLPDSHCIPIQRAQLAVYAGRTYLQNNQLVEARRCYLKALEVDASYGEAVYYLGVLALAQGRFQEARLWYQMATLYPDDPVTIMQQENGCTRDLPYLGLAEVAFKQGNRQEAYQLLDQAARKALCERAGAAALRARLDET